MLVLQLKTLSHCKPTSFLVHHYAHSICALCQIFPFRELPCSGCKQTIQKRNGHLK